VGFFLQSEQKMQFQRWALGSYAVAWKVATLSEVGPVLPLLLSRMNNTLLRFCIFSSQKKVEESTLGPDDLKQSQTSQTKRWRRGCTSALLAPFPLHL